MPKTPKTPSYATTASAASYAGDVSGGSQKLNLNPTKITPAFGVSKSQVGRPSLLGGL